MAASGCRFFRTGSGGMKSPSRHGRLFFLRNAFARIAASRLVLLHSSRYPMGSIAS